jgi:hypothetical protein
LAKYRVSNGDKVTIGTKKLPNYCSFGALLELTWVQVGPKERLRVTCRANLSRGYPLEQDNETYFSAEQPGSQTAPRLSCPYGYKSWPQNIERASRSRPKRAVSLDSALSKAVL